jgi:hypothetical protein
MTEPANSSFLQAMIASFGAGIASALLCSVVQPQSGFGVILFLISPLPLVVAGLSYHHLVAALAALIGCLFLDLLVGSTLSIAYALLAGLPAFLLVFAIVQRRGRGGTLRDAAGYLGPGVILTGIAVYVSGLILIASIWVNPNYAGFRAYLYSALAESVKTRLEIEGGQDLRLPDGLDLEPFLRFYARLMPSLATIPFFVMLSVSGYLGARVALVSQRLQRPWPNFRHLRLPPLAVILLIAATVLIFAHGYPGLAGELFTISIGLCFVIQGLAVVHAKVGHRPRMRWLIAMSWLLVIVFSISSLGFLVLGLIDQIFDLRKLRGANTNSIS